MKPGQARREELISSLQTQPGPDIEEQLPEQFLDGLHLAALDNLGIRVDDNGRLTNWRDWPPDAARPFEGNPDEPQTKERFTAAEERLLLLCCTAAEEQGVLGNNVFEQLECIVSITSSSLTSV